MELDDQQMWDEIHTDKEYPIEAPPPDPMKREIISEVLPLGVKAVDGLITIGKGTAYWNFAGSELVRVPCLVCLQEIPKRISM